MDAERRTFNTPLREPINPIIHRLLQAVDWHNARYFEDQNPWHLEKAASIRQYVSELKTWIHEKEKNGMEIMGASPRRESGQE
jgi:2-succinyl-5-enolpyruvyl-6-hydroxy-3-cyclohexene-1-carboxylate synthase